LELKNQSDKKIVVIDGLWGCGKTTLAKSLSKTMGARCFVHDEYREILVDSGKYQGSKDSPELDQLSHANMMGDLVCHLDAFSTTTCTNSR